MSFTTRQSPARVLNVRKVQEDKIFPENAMDEKNMEKEDVALSETKPISHGNQTADMRQDGLQRAVNRYSLPRYVPASIADDPFPRGPAEG
jgi:hypothetical protein